MEIFTGLEPLRFRIVLFEEAFELVFIEVFRLEEGIGIDAVGLLTDKTGFWEHFHNLLEDGFILVETVFGIRKRSSLRNIQFFEMAGSHESILAASNDLRDLHRMFAFSVQLTHHL